MDNLSNYFNTLLQIEIAVFGIISAVILVFVQLVYSKFSYKLIKNIALNKLLILFYFFSLIDLLLTSMGSFFLSIGKYDFFPNINFNINRYITNQNYGLFCLVLIFVSIFFFVFLIVKNIEFLHPDNAIFLLSEMINYQQIRDFIWKSSDLKPPIKIKISLVDHESSLGSVHDTLQTEKQESKDEESRKAEALEKKIRSIKRKTKNAEDPFLPIKDMGIQFIKQSDISSLTQLMKLFSTKSIDFINEVYKVDRLDEWTPKKVLSVEFTSYFIETQRTMLEIANKEELVVCKKLILQTSLDYSKKLYICEYYSELEQLLDLWKRTADNSVGVSSSIFQEIVGYYQELGDMVFDNLSSDVPINILDYRYKILEIISRDIGWLGERLLIKVPLEESPIMRNYGYSSEFDDLYNCLLSFSDRYEFEQPGSYPLIYFAALNVVLRRLMMIYEKDQESSIDEKIYSLSYAFATFAEKAIEVNNANGAALAVMEIDETYLKLKEHGIDKIAHDVLHLLINIGILAKQNKETLEQVEFLDNSLDEWIINKLVESGEVLENQVVNKYIQTLGRADHNARWSFITELGVRLGTNFGLMFDAATGEIYSEGDPRRR